MLVIYMNSKTYQTKLKDDVDFYEECSSLSKEGFKNITTKNGLKIGRDKMKKVYSKKYPDILLGIIHKFDEIPKGRVDIHQMNNLFKFHP